ncbi:MAG: hypothetical protein ACLT2F_01270 [Butyricicoccus sp.]
MNSAGTMIGGSEPYRVIDPHWVEAQEIAEPAEWHPAQQLITYLETLFDNEEHVGYVTRSFSNEDGKAMPTKGDWARTAGQLVQALSACGDDIGSVLGDYDPAVGAWIRFNPLDGKGIRNENVTAFRYALVECDGMDIDRQNALIRELELPVACLVHRGKASRHRSHRRTRLPRVPQAGRIPVHGLPQERSGTRPAEPQSVAPVAYAGRDAKGTQAVPHRHQHRQDGLCRVARVHRERDR